MKNQILVIVVLIISIVSCAKSNTVEILFNEGDNNWEIKGTSSWSFQDNELVAVADSTRGFVVTKANYKNFELNLEFKPDNTINSGVFVRCNTDDISATNCYEINIWDLHPNQDNRTGAIVTRVKPLKKVETLNKWNTYKIICEGNVLNIWVNDILTATLEDDQLIEGTIALQAFEHGEIRFRNVTITQL
ncbi:DUF1080 domain-containing protein [Flavobacteriaceae bacterium AU392]|nr:DUF1080 domain-containing protein [Flavobacteriaceae bacterium]RKM83611.1 DUF1080 domain-containing protein [Flavobacteriaceae bacterium AU392]